MINKDQLEAALCRESFYDFVQRFWDEIIAEEPVWNWHIKFLCDELQVMAERVFLGLPKEYDLVINISPGSTKSTVATRMFPVWCWIRMATTRTICASYAFRLAENLGRSSRDIVRSAKWKRLFPEVWIRQDSEAKAHFVNNHGGDRMAVGTGGATGEHADFIIIDDPLDPLEAISDVSLASVIYWLANKLSTRKKNRAISPTIMIMQRLHQGDPSADMLAKAKSGKLRVRHINLPAEIDDSTRRDVRPRKLAKFYRKGLMDPLRLSRNVLDEALAEIGAYGYAGQYHQNPVPAGGGMFKTNRIEIGEPPKRFTTRVRYWDKAGTGGGGAWTVGALLAETQEGFIWILDVVRGQWEANEREKTIKQTAIMDKTRTKIGVEQEPGSGGKESAQSTVRNLRGFRVLVDRPTGNKVLRADPFSVQVNAGNVYMKEAPWNQEFLEEMKFFPLSKYKDQVDAASGAFNILTRPRRRAGGLRKS